MSVKVGSTGGSLDSEQKAKKYHLLVKAKKATRIIEVATTTEGISDLKRMQMLTKALTLNFGG